MLVSEIPRMSIYEWASLITNGVLATATVGALWVIYRQLKETQRTARLQQRAWVGVHNITGTGPIPNQPFSITIQIRNTGKTPARKVRTSIYFQDLNAGEIPDFSNDSSTPYGVKSLAPDERDDRTIDVFTPVTQAQLDDWKFQKKVFWIAGKIFYQDIFGCEHWTTFCYEWHENLKGYTDYKIHNETDDNC